MLEYFLMLFVRRSPMFLLLIGGIVFALFRWKRHPRVSLMTIVALVLYFLESILFTLLLYWIPSKLETPLIILDDFAYAAIIVLLVAAAFIQRRAITPAPVPPPPE